MASNNHTPEEIIQKILDGFPVKYLIRFSTVSKRWHHLVFYDPKFAKSHLDLASRKKTLGHRLLVFKKTEILSLVFDKPSFKDKFSVRKIIACPFNKHEVENISLLGCCNGLVLLTLKENEFHIWNPTTRYLKKLPDPCSVSRKKKNDMYKSCGLGYVSATDEYKVILTYRGSVEMSSLRANNYNWRRIEAPLEFQDYMGYVSKGTLLNETLHWLHTSALFAFDLAKEESSQVPLPTLEPGWAFHYHVGVIDEKLCLCSSWRKFGEARQNFQLWVTREYGVCESGTKFELVKRTPLLAFPVFYSETGIFMNA